MFATPGSMPMPGSSAALGITRVAAVALLLVFLAVALLYAYRSQTPAIPDVDISQAIQDINAGRVRAVTVVANKATVDFRDSPSHREQTTVPEPDTVLAPAVASYNAANTAQPITVRFEPGTQPTGVLGSIVLGLLPVLLIGGLLYFLMGKRRGSQR
jgi:ATP-dependent Zn protease